jgi:hypothetical protein
MGFSLLLNKEVFLMTHLQKDMMLALLAHDIEKTRDKYSDENVKKDLQYFVDYIHTMLPKIKEEAHA